MSNIIQSFKEQLFTLRPQDFEEAALTLFRFQAIHNPTYAYYLYGLRVKIDKINKLHQIPFMPIEFFKTQLVLTAYNQQIPAGCPLVEFESSGTTGQQPSRHTVLDSHFYLRIAQDLFERKYGKLENYHILALLPSYLERQTSSLVYMIQHFINQSPKESDFFLHDYEALAEKLKKLANSPKKILLIGVTFALLDFAESHPKPLQNTILMETGGMKGRKKELLREEVHQILQAAFALPAIHSEYGMTELLSQAYSQGQGIFRPSKTMRIFLRNLQDPFEVGTPTLREGGVNIIDLANVESCAFIETKDIGAFNLRQDTFQILGRYDHSDTRGCNLIAS